MPIPAPQTANLPDEIQITQILIAPQSPMVRMTVELLRNATRTEDKEVPPSEEGGEPTTEEVEVPYVESLGYRSVPVPDPILLMAAYVEPGETIYDAIKRVCYAWLQENFTL